MKKATVIVFPGSNCDMEAFSILKKSGFDATFTWHNNPLPNDIDLCFIPGGFSYGDYLRSGAIAGHSSIIEDIKQFADSGGFVVGVCNGFQILTEAKILPGALLKNACGHFVCKSTKFEVANTDLHFLKDLKKDIAMQVAHGDGMFVADDKTLEMLEKENRVFLKYKENFNGSMRNIAGIIGGRNYNIIGMMPHPERSLSNSDAISIFYNLALN